MAYRDRSSGPPPWSPRSRAEKLLAERDALGRPLVFVAAAETGSVHVVGPDEDQPGCADIVDALMTRRFRTVCGPVIRKTPLDGYTGVFDDERLCRRCAAAFRAIHVDAGAAIFADNTEDVQNRAPGEVARIQRQKQDEKEEGAR